MGLDLCWTLNHNSYSAVQYKPMHTRQNKDTALAMCVYLFIFIFFLRKSNVQSYSVPLYKLFSAQCEFIYQRPSGSTSPRVPHFLENLACLCLGGAHFRHNVSTVKRTEQIRARSLQDRHVEKKLTSNTPKQHHSTPSVLFAV